MKCSLPNGKTRASNFKLREKGITKIKLLLDIKKV